MSKEENREWLKAFAFLVAVTGGAVVVLLHNF
jgi:hypothetical protein